MSEQAPIVSPRGRLVGHAVLAAAGLGALAIALRLGLWRQNSPGEGLFPFLAALAMVAFSVAGLVRDWTKLEQAHERSGERPNGPQFASRPISARSCSMRSALEFLGFIVASAITLVFILRFAERYSWLATLALLPAPWSAARCCSCSGSAPSCRPGTLWADLFGW